MNIPGPPPVTNVVSFVAPDRFHMIMNQGGGSASSEFFVIGKEVWIKNAGGCGKMPAAINLPNPREGLQQASDAVIQVTRGGAEAVEGTPTQTYNLVITSQGTTVRQKLYVATATGLPLAGRDDHEVRVERPG